jgi:hypothetical protein
MLLRPDFPAQLDASAPLADLVAQTNSSATTGASGSFIDEFNPRGLQRRHDFRQTLDYSPNDTIARFHPLDCRKRDPEALANVFCSIPARALAALICAAVSKSALRQSGLVADTSYFSVD